MKSLKRIVARNFITTSVMLIIMMIAVFANMQIQMIEEQAGAGGMVSLEQLYENVPVLTGVLAVAMILLAIVLYWAMTGFTKYYVLDNIEDLNEKLQYVTEGNPGVFLSNDTSEEVCGLYNSINDMMNSLLKNADKLGFVLDRTNIHIGVYEYNAKMKKVLFTDQVPDILGLEGEAFERIMSDSTLFQTYIDQIRRQPVSDMEIVYHFTGNQEKYLEMEELSDGENTIGLVMDVTENYLIRRRIESERDRDALTGLYNRRGMDQKLEEIVKNTDDYKRGAIVVINADGLKTVNSEYGHIVGDRYIQYIADKLRNFGLQKRAVARQSGDEFDLVVYGYHSDKAVEDDLKKLSYMQDEMVLELEDGRRIPIHFSYGYVLTDGRQDYKKMFSEATVNMREFKQVRKKRNFRSGGTVSETVKMNNPNQE